MRQGRTILGRVEEGRVFRLEMPLLAFYEVEKVRDTREGWGSTNIV